MRIVVVPGLIQIFQIMKRGKIILHEKMYLLWRDFLFFAYEH